MRGNGIRCAKYVGICLRYQSVLASFGKAVTSLRTKQWLRNWRNDCGRAGGLGGWAGLKSVLYYAVVDLVSVGKYAAP